MRSAAAGSSRGTILVLANGSLSARWASGSHAGANDQPAQPDQVVRGGGEGEYSVDEWRPLQTAVVGMKLQ
jgi:hypothetical protein